MIHIINASDFIRFMHSINLHLIHNELSYLINELLLCHADMNAGTYDNSVEFLRENYYFMELVYIDDISGPGPAFKGLYDGLMEMLSIENKHNALKLKKYDGNIIIIGENI